MLHEGSDSSSRLLEKLIQYVESLRGLEEVQRGVLHFVQTFKAHSHNHRTLYNHVYNDVFDVVDDTPKPDVADLQCLLCTIL